MPAPEKSSSALASPRGASFVPGVFAAFSAIDCLRLGFVFTKKKTDYQLSVWDESALELLLQDYAGEKLKSEYWPSQVSIVAATNSDFKSNLTFTKSLLEKNGASCIANIAVGEIDYDKHSLLIFVGIPLQGRSLVREWLEFSLSRLQDLPNAPKIQPTTAKILHDLDQHSVSMFEYWTNDEVVRQRIKYVFWETALLDNQDSRTRLAMYQLLALNGLIGLGVINKPDKKSKYAALLQPAQRQDFSTLRGITQNICHSVKLAAQLCALQPNQKIENVLHFDEAVTEACALTNIE